MLTVKVWASMSATPTVAEPVSKLVLAPPAVTVKLVCAGRNPLGFHCTTRSLSHVNVPAWGADDATSMVRVTASRSVIGPGEGHRHRNRHSHRRSRRLDGDDVGGRGDARGTGRNGSGHGDRRDAQHDQGGSNGFQHTIILVCSHTHRFPA